MSRRSKKKLEAPDLLALADRVNRLDNGEIIEAMDLTLSTLCKYVPEYRRTKDFYLLNEIDMAAQAIYVMSTELATRREHRPPTKPARQTRQMREY